MPTYGYECLSCKEQFETVQRITADALKIHDNCGGELRRLLYPVGIVFKGPGFYVNDYGKKDKSGPSESKPESKAEKTETKTETASEVKAETKTETAPAATAE